MIEFILKKSNYKNRFFLLSEILVLIFCLKKTSQFAKRFFFSYKSSFKQVVQTFNFELKLKIFLTLDQFYI